MPFEEERWRLGSSPNSGVASSFLRHYPAHRRGPECQFRPDPLGCSAARLPLYRWARGQGGGFGG
jgi:hypothetical protein